MKASFTTNKNNIIPVNNFFHFFMIISEPVQKFYRLNNPPQPNESLEASQVCDF